MEISSGSRSVNQRRLEDLILAGMSITQIGIAVGMEDSFQIQNNFNAKGITALVLQGWNKYSIIKVYSILMEENPRVRWDRNVWESLTISKHQFTAWLTRDRLLKAGLVRDPSCPLCLTSEETVDHLFFSCSYSAQILKAIKEWLGKKTQASHLSQMYIRINRTQTGSKLKRKIWNVAINAIVCCIWQQQGQAEEQMIKKIKMQILVRLNPSKIDK
ncbi:Methionine--tRNA ligase, partial [Bienertia sinuspersici]